MTPSESSGTYQTAEEYNAARASRPMSKDEQIASLEKRIAELEEASLKATRACMAAWAAGEPLHRVEAMISSIEALERVLASPRRDEP